MALCSFTSADPPTGCCAKSTALGAAALSLEPERSVAFIINDLPRPRRSFLQINTEEGTLASPRPEPYA